MKNRTAIASWTVLLVGLLASPTAPAQVETLEKAYAAFEEEKYDEVLKELEPLLKQDPAASPEAATARDVAATAYQRRGEDHFRNGRVRESVADFDAFLALVPSRAPHHWQRGISLYYAEDYQKGVEQFETHQTVNAQDVENAVWHFLCAVRAPGGSVEKARADFINIQQDGRIPMKQVHDLFAGTGTEADVIQAASGRGDSAEFYADLYLGLYHEAMGNHEKAMTFITRAAENPSSQHYMGDVARTHLIVRGRENAAKGN